MRQCAPSARPRDEAADPRIRPAPAPRVFSHCSRDHPFSRPANPSAGVLAGTRRSQASSALAASLYRRLPPPGGGRRIFDGTDGETGRNFTHVPMVAKVLKAVRSYK